MSIAQPRLSDTLNCSIKSQCDQGRNVVIKNITVSRMVSHGKWADCWRLVAGQFCTQDVFVAGWCCPLHDNCSVFSRCGGWVVTWLVVEAISERSMRSCSRAWDLAPKQPGWQQVRSSLALAPVSSPVARVETEGSFYKGRGGIEQLQYSMCEGQLALQFVNHTDG